ncbi:MAG: hypothetical protein K8T25_14790 [Planctomycetia bacterium]|nr:hypothetical protein [Planctomycetia bacterium]
MKRLKAKKRCRGGALLVLSAVLLVVLLGMVACAIDMGTTVLVRTQLQATADAAALAAVRYIPDLTTVTSTAQLYANLNHPNHGNVLTSQNVQLGTWNSSTKTFTPSNSSTNAVQVTVTRTQATGNPVPLSFAGILGLTQSNVTATSIAVRNPRDIVFVMDLSGSMNNDTEIWATAAIDSKYAPSGYPNLGSTMMTNVFADFGYGAYPGTLQYMGNGNVTQDNQAFYNLTRNGGYLSGSTINATYKILTSDSAATRKQKGYKWIIDTQLATVMPLAKPVPNSTTNYAYWEVYLDYIIQPYTLTTAQRTNYSNYTGSVPANQNSYGISSADNPSSDAWPSLTSSAATVFYNKFGYQTYVQFMMDFGRNRVVTGSTYTPLSTASSFCPYHQDTDPSSAGYGFNFPPREQPTHAARVGIMAAIDTIAQRNAGLAESAKDHVALVTFDTAADTVVRYPLNVNSCDYNAVKQACTTYQAVADDQSSTAGENGLILAKNQLDPTLNPTGARPGADKVVVYLSDGVVNVKQSSNTTIQNYETSYDATHNPDGEWFTSSDNNYQERNAVMMQVGMMQALDWHVYAVGIGLASDQTMMDRMARLSGTAVQDPNNPTGPKISPVASGNPADYQQRLSDIFSTIVGSTEGALVK